MTQWLYDAQTELVELQNYITNNGLENDAFAQAELASKKDLINELSAMPKRWITAVGKSVPEYLGFGARIQVTIMGHNNTPFMLFAFQRNMLVGYQAIYIQVFVVVASSIPIKRHSISS